MDHSSKASYYGYELRAFCVHRLWNVEILDLTGSPVTHERVVSAQFANKAGAESYAEHFVRDHYRQLGEPISIASTPEWQEIGWAAANRQTPWWN